MPVAGLNWITLVVASMLKPGPLVLPSGARTEVIWPLASKVTLKLIGVLFDGSSGLTPSISTFMVQLFSGIGGVAFGSGSFLMKNWLMVWSCPGCHRCPAKRTSCR